MSKTCIRCGQTFPGFGETVLRSTVVEAHYTDYTKLLDIVWLCKKCHSQTGRVALSNGL